jgi:hypothetical protein
MIDIVEALDLLDGCVRERGSSYRTPGRPALRSTDGGHPDVERPATEGIVALAMTKGGVAPGEVSRLAGRHIADVYSPGRDRCLNLTVGAVVVFRAAELVERRGETWGACLQGAVRTAARFVEVLPDSSCAGASAMLREAPHVQLATM